MSGNVVMVSGIDTGIGKTWATGMVAGVLHRGGCRVMTLKLAQTGCSGIADDIREHRKLMGLPLLPLDLNGLSCPYVFPYPASPHLAAQLAGRQIDPVVLDRAADQLAAAFDMLFVEGAGGLMVPLRRELLFIDYLAARGYPLLLVTSSRLGSINHTLLSLEACANRGIELKAMFYNRFQEEERLIGDDSRAVIAEAACRYGYDVPVIDLPAGGQEGAERFGREVRALALCTSLRVHQQETRTDKT
ncbi:MULTISPECIES: dethiobiotin synthase [Prosthecochloris]|uniref:ATP-dependent dethiobiotin synthetase BioD n=1 Tax=Prosthecochloris vibrioformis TaxID=1098 RepID=A0A5C4S3I9_PROVB|nr:MULTISPECIES: dethiobiotin synthase [Prosthecochloris]ANT65936.1 ATP-dependent dethiobiotin synthetase BioD 1 [Prosthecochloris sp. CIB 2401]TNJ37712.1 ATP-dependent dethiobiotin synthetase BioD [Prosthecochloris vibrioformis]